jgi:hypothetical protein
MYLVIHHDEDRGQAIVEALGGPETARLVPSAVDAMRFAEVEGPPRAVLACPDAVEGIWVAHELPAEPDREGVPVLFDGGRTGAVYRAFAKQWGSKRPFHHLRGATPAQAAEALRALAATAAPRAAPRPAWRRWTPAVLFAAYLVVKWSLPGLVPTWLERAIVAVVILDLVGRHLVAPMVAALRRGLRPSAGSVVALALFLFVVVDNGRAALRGWLGG